MNSDQVKDATLEQVLCSSVRLDNCQALADRYTDLTGMTVYVIWNRVRSGSDRFCLLDQGQMNCLRLTGRREGDIYWMIYCSDQPGKWLTKPERIDPPLAYGRVRCTREDTAERES